jgi:hypothetical protein
MNGAENNNQQSTFERPAAPPSPPYAYGEQPSRAKRGYKSAALATILSMMPGVGQVYAGYYQQGFINIVVFASVIVALSSGMLRGFEPFLGIFLAFFWIFNLIDANRRALHVNRVIDGLGAESVPEDFKIPGSGGSVVTGVLLMGLGLLFFLDLKFDVSMEWVTEWWPLALIAGGAWMVYKAKTKGD